MGQWGYVAQDVPKLFKIFCSSRGGQTLTVEEFSQMVQDLGLGMHKRRVEQLFDLFDQDGSGTIDQKEFVRGIFPREYRRTYVAREEDEARKTRALSSMETLVQL